MLILIKLPPILPNDLSVYEIGRAILQILDMMLCKVVCCQTEVEKQSGSMQF